MDIKDFKKILGYVLTAAGLSKHKNSYYIKKNGITTVVGLQKSNYSNGYYICLGYLIESINPAAEKLREVDGDLRSRFDWTKNKKETDFFNLDELQVDDEPYLLKELEKNVQKYITPVTSVAALKLLIEQWPTMLYQTTLVAKQHFGFEL